MNDAENDQQLVPVLYNAVPKIRVAWLPALATAIGGVISLIAFGSPAVASAACDYNCQGEYNRYCYGPGLYLGGVPYSTYSSCGASGGFDSFIYGINDIGMIGYTEPGYSINSTCFQAAACSITSC